MKTSGIGGQAVIEGVMMRNKGQYAVAVRKPDGEIVVKTTDCKDPATRPLFLRLPLVRGVVSFIDSLKIGMSTLTYSSSFYEDEEPSKFEEKLNKISKGHADGIINTVTILLSVVLAMVIFLVTPWALKNALARVVNIGWVLALFEGVIRVVIFIIYILLISTMQDIKRMFKYHGAEHKCINCIEHGLDLTVENVRVSSKEHRRCGTGFMLNVMILSIIFFMFINVGNPFLQLGLRILMVPVIAGIAYEFLRFAGRKDNLFTKIISRPGMLMQALTTYEPDDEMIEVGIKSVEAVFDWKAFVATVNAPATDTPAEKREEAAEAPAAAPAEETEEPAHVAEEPVATQPAEPAPVVEEQQTKLPEVDLSALFDIKLSTPAETTVKKPSKSSKKDKEPAPAILQPARDSDELLAALDFMFEYDGPKTEIEITDEEGVVVTKQPTPED